MDGRPVLRPSTAVAADSEILCSLPEPEDIGLDPEDLHLELPWQDEHLAFVIKPAGVPVHPDHHHHRGTLVHGLLHALAGELSGIGGVERPGIVHRLDQGTSGVLVVAKNDRTHRALGELFSRHAIEREYLALIRGRLRGGSLRIDRPIERHPGDRKRMTSKTGSGRRAVTHVAEEEVFGPPFAEVSLVTCRLETGRTHQIRAHLSDEGHGILGDPTYGPRKGLAWVRSKALKALLATLDRPMLHARSLGFDHPITGAHLRVEAPLPSDFEGLLSALRGAVASGP
jgi:23S rRNA pseudouridine1911/1915/1917 synthase